MIDSGSGARPSSRPTARKSSAKLPMAAMMKSAATAPTTPVPAVTTATTGTTTAATATTRSAASLLGSAPATPAEHKAKGRPIAIPRRSRTRVNSSKVVLDEEGNTDVYKTLITHMKQAGQVEKEPSETLNMDWRAARSQVGLELTRMLMQHAFVPRVGEIVLWIPHTQGEIRYNEATRTFQVYSPPDDKFLGPAEWRAGIVTQTPETPTLLEDAFTTPPRKTALSISGLRVETLDNPNGVSRHYSRQYKYVPFSLTRPMNYWQLFLHNVPSAEWHPSIRHAMTAMSTLSIVNKTQFRGRWPNASVTCGGVFIGAELYRPGDGVRLLPRDTTIASLSSNFSSVQPVTDVLVIEHIEVYLENLDQDPKSPLLCESTAVRITGKGYTTDPSHAFCPADLGRPTPLSDDEIIDAFQAVGMRGYSPWYRTHDSNSVCRVSPDRIVGRVVESDYMLHMFGDVSLTYDLSGVLTVRDYARKSDTRIPKNGEWYFGNTRVDTLALETVNGIEVGRFDNARDSRMFSASLKIIDGVATHQNIRDSNLFGRSALQYPVIGTTENADAHQYQSVGKTSTMVSTAMDPPAVGKKPNGQDVEAEGRPEHREEAGDEQGSGSRIVVSVDNNRSGQMTTESDDELAMELTTFLNNPMQYEGGGTNDSGEEEYREGEEIRDRKKRRRRERARYF